MENNAAKKKKEEWTKPVSQKFYTELGIHVSNCLREMGVTDGWKCRVMAHVDRYLANGTRPSPYVEELEFNMFIMLRRDIDKAMERSAMGRRRAAERRAIREAEKAKQDKLEKEKPGKEKVGKTDKDQAVKSENIEASSKGNNRQKAEGKECRDNKKAEQISAPDRVGKQGAVEQGTTKSDLVSVLDLVADGNPACKLGDTHIGIGSETAIEIEVGGLPLHRGT